VDLATRLHGQAKQVYLVEQQITWQLTGLCCTRMKQCLILSEYCLWYNYCNESGRKIILTSTVQRFLTARFCSEKTAQWKSSLTLLLGIESICHVYM